MINAPLKGFDPGQFLPVLNVPCLVELVDGRTMLAVLERNFPTTAIWYADSPKPTTPRDRVLIIPNGKVKQWAHLPEWRASPLEL